MKGTNRFELRKASVAVPSSYIDNMSAPLNAEPADVEGRKDAGLEPKSFAAAAMQEPPVKTAPPPVADAESFHGPSQSKSKKAGKKNAHTTNGQTNGTSEQHEEKADITGVQHTGEELKHSVLRITDTGADHTSTQNEKPKEEKHEFEAAVNSQCLHDDFY